MNLYTHTLCMHACTLYIYIYIYIYTYIYIHTHTHTHTYIHTQKKNKQTKNKQVSTYPVSLSAGTASFSCELSGFSSICFFCGFLERSLLTRSNSRLSLYIRNKFSTCRRERNQRTGERDEKERK